MIVDQINNEEIKPFSGVAIGKIFLLNNKSYLKTNNVESVEIGVGSLLELKSYDKVKVATKVTIEY